MQWKVDFIWQPVVPAQWLDWEETPKYCPKPNLHWKKVMVTVWWSAAHIWSTTVCWNFVKPLHLRNMPSKSIWCTKNHNTCNWFWSKERAQFLPGQHPTTCHTANTSKAEQLGLWSFASAIFTWLLAIRLPLLKETQKLFAGKMLPQPVGGRKCFPRVHWILKQIFYATGIKNLFLIGKNVLIVMVPILMNKAIFEFSNNGLKFTIQNLNYFCINLIHPQGSSLVSQGQAWCLPLMSWTWLWGRCGVTLNGLEDPWFE